MSDVNKMQGFLTSHWLVYKRGDVSGCHCGFVVPLGDNGFGDSVVAHIAGEAIREAVMAWAEHAPDDGVAFTRAEVADVLFRHADSLDGGPR